MPVTADVGREALLEISIVARGVADKIAREQGQSDCCTEAVAMALELAYKEIYEEHQCLSS